MQKKYDLAKYSGFERWVKGIRIGDFLIFQAKDDEWIVRDKSKHFSQNGAIIFGFATFEDAVGFAVGE